MSIFYFDEFEITHLTNKKYCFTAKSEPNKPPHQTPVDDSDVISSRELRFEIEKPNMGQEYILNPIDFQNYARYDALRIVLLKNGVIMGRDPKAQFVIRHTKYPPPDKARFLDAGSIGVDEPDPDNPRFLITKIVGKRTGTGVYTLTFRLKQTEASRRYVAEDYRAIYDENNFVVALALILKKETTTGHPVEMDFPRPTSEERNFDLTTPVPVIVLEKTDANYLDVDWTTVKTKVALLKFD